MSSSHRDLIQYTLVNKRRKKGP